MELNYVFGTAAVMLGLFTIQVVTRRFDPFAPIWLFLVGYFQVYVVQAISYHDWAVNVRGEELVGLANQRALWSLVLFLVVYYSGLGRLFAPLLPRPPAQWSTSSINLISPVFIIWGLVCSGVLLRSEDSSAADLSPEAALLRSFPFLMLIAANLLIVTGGPGRIEPAYLSLDGSDGRRRLRLHLDVQRQAFTLLDRRALGRLRFLHRAAEAAVVARPDGDGSSPGSWSSASPSAGGTTRRREIDPRSRRIPPVHRRFPTLLAHGEPEHRGGRRGPCRSSSPTRRWSTAASC